MPRLRRTLIKGKEFSFRLFPLLLEYDLGPYRGLFLIGAAYGVPRSKNF